MVGCGTGRRTVVVPLPEVMLLSGGTVTRIPGVTRLQLKENDIVYLVEYGYDKDVGARAIRGGSG